MHMSRRSLIYRILAVNLLFIFLVTLKQTRDASVDPIWNPNQPYYSDHHRGVHNMRDNFERILNGNGPADTYLDTRPDMSTANLDRTKAKTILVKAHEGFSDEHLNGCPDYNCKVTEDESLAEVADAVVFYHGTDSASDSLTLKRKLHQYYVFFSLESPSFEPATEPYAGFYNLTMGFLRNSDIPCPYGYATKLNRPTTDWSINEVDLSRRNRTALWFVSHCGAPSGRDQYVSELKKYMPVDIYGACGENTCAKSSSCDKALLLNHRFYLALENSLCTDYLTEKLWGRSYTSGLVPVVLKRSIVENLVPPNSFLAADDYKSPKELAKHLLHLMKDDRAYLKYFEWRKRYRTYFLDGTVHDWRERPWGFCKLCKLLWQTPRIHKVSNASGLIHESQCNNDFVISSLIPH